MQVGGEQQQVGDEHHSETDFSGPESDDCGDELVPEEKMVRVWGGGGPEGIRMGDTGSGDERVVRPTITHMAEMN
jgi:hypothetical protein